MSSGLPEQRIHCPFCGETITIVVDTSAGSQSYIEDCQVCCQPMQVFIEAADGELLSVHVDR
ncbi:MAG: CPXCG motif-containing cysteine-rich protein [Gammaproteobacteria bacterium]|nr:CPXCG motif-containing cysteine-rich protein [Gammaproteobacteria bacterium]MDH3408359.1 CPXCG motif-containing cysteine-rich protein [Gammaproteobacteria bacterium]MDH3553091.1 CPXCG motif-containing cysteine-rich protein [Gammaproteobacteria bacterium]